MTLSPPGPPQGSAPLLTSPLVPSHCSNGPAPGFWLVQQCTRIQLRGSMSLFSLSLASSLLPCSGSSQGLSKKVHSCHVAKSSWHPFSMLMREQLWIFKMMPGASERQNRKRWEWQMMGDTGGGSKTGEKEKQRGRLIQISKHHYCGYPTQRLTTKLQL